MLILISKTGYETCISEQTSDIKRTTIETEFSSNDLHEFKLFIENTQKKTYKKCMKTDISFKILVIKKSFNSYFNKLRMSSIIVFMQVDIFILIHVLFVFKEYHSLLQ